MNCSEVMELMQRKLDGDLNDSEQHLLTEHINHCPACSEMARRLERLHTELVQLPKIEPKFSLVDAIMPALDIIDRDEQLAAVEPNVEAFSQEAVSTGHAETGSSIKPRIVKETAKPQPTQQRWFERIRWRATSAVIAAGLVLGLFIVNFKPPTVEQAGDFSELGNEQLMKTETADRSDSSQVTKSESSSPMKEKPSNNDPQNNPTEPSSYATTEGTGEADKEKSAQDRQKEMKDSSQQKIGIPKPKDVESKESTSHPKKGQETVSADRSSATGGQTRTRPDADKQPPNQDGQKEDAKKDPQQKDTEQVLAEEPPKEPQKDGIDKMPEQKEINSLVGPSITSVAEATAPNGSLMATWDNGQLLLYKLNGQERTKLQTIAVAEKPSELIWSADSSKLTVVSSGEDGKSSKLQYELKNETLEPIVESGNPAEKEVIQGSIQQSQ
ncbi:anti-sigma factor family protein [Paenibacillus alvei]|uniref:Putative zinc-finger domain-containing protein n=1 Tax=Paenibacillus alvei TaxID=44250 RepID=A0A383R5X4_PAEAL|nr:zf-HC2 domain-containing protein [Paenibacillus alvei]SYX82485.1 conserved protein of unknown function [Paenibacillus alvei]